MTTTSSPTLTPSIRKPRSRPRRRAKWIKRGLLAAGALGVLGAIAYAWMPSPVTVDTAIVSRGPLEVTVEEDGRTRVRDRFVVAAPVGGELERIELEPGAAVAPGQVLVRIRPPAVAMLDARSRDEVRARLSGALAQQRRADTAARAAAATHAIAVRNAERARALFGGGAISAVERERAELAAEQADADRGAAALQRDAAAAEVRGVRAVLAGGAGDETAVPVIAPVAARVLRVVRDSAGPIAAGAPLLELGDPTALEVVVDVLSTDAARIPLDAPVVIDAWGGERPLTGRVRVVEPSAVTRVSALGIEEQRVDVVVALDAPPATLGDGFRVEASIRLWRGDAVVTVPAGALFRHRGGWAVYAIVGGRARLTPVEVGRRGATAVEIGDLAPGARVILHPSDRVRDGTRVAPR